MDNKHHPNYFAVWIWLMGLVIVSIAASMVLPRSAAVYLIFLVAAIKAILVVLNYMHLKYERLLLYALAIVPILIVVVLLFALFPDFVFHG
ncbi:MAG: cytochrome C oxidase subunit IV family protein [Candidatus Binatia bacterium]